jgi:hypothetical protein
LSVSFHQLLALELWDRIAQAFAWGNALLDPESIDS